MGEVQILSISRKSQKRKSSFLLEFAVHPGTEPREEHHNRDDERERDGDAEIGDRWDGSERRREKRLCRIQSSRF